MNFRRLKDFAENRWVNLLSAIVLVLTAVQEIFDRTEEGGFHIGHGLLIFALVQVLRVLPHLSEGVSRIGDQASDGED